MQLKKILISLAVAVAALLPRTAAAQSSSINAFSPYTMYGIGELNTPGTLPTRSMGGAGVAMRKPGFINLLNPAAFSTVQQKSFLFDFGIEGQNYYNAQKVDGATKKSAYNTFNFHDIALQFPLAKKIGAAFGLTPYSSVGYRTRGFEIKDEYGYTNYLFEGDGDLTEVKFGIGWEIFKNFSIGAAAQYYWGDINRTFVMTPANIVDNTTIASTVGKDTYTVSRFKGQFGVQWTPLLDDKRMLTVGATYDIGGDLRPDRTSTIYVGNNSSATVVDKTEHIALALPRQIAAGVFYRTPKLSLGFDYVYQDWRSVNSGLSETTAAGYEVAYTNTSTYKIGVEYTPNYMDARRFLNRWSYRAGFRYGDYNQTFGGKRLAQYAVTVGIGIPVRFLSASAVDVGFEYGYRGRGGDIAPEVGFIRQRYFKFSVGFSLFASPGSQEYWFIRPKFD